MSHDEKKKLEQKTTMIGWGKVCMCATFNQNQCNCDQFYFNHCAHDSYFIINMSNSENRDFSFDLKKSYKRNALHRKKNIYYVPSGNSQIKLK